MDADRFDTLTRSLSAAASSRRQLLTGLAGTALGAVTTALGVTEAGAFHFACVHVGKPCSRRSQCCSSRCRGPQGGKTCRAHHVGVCTAAKDVCLTGGPRCGAVASDECECYVTTGGANFCSGHGGGGCMACTTDAQCVTKLAIPGSACVTVNHGPICGTGCSNGIQTFQTECRPPCPS